MDTTIIYEKNQPIEVNSLFLPTVLKDVSSTGRVRPWRDKKIMSEALANIYTAFNVSKSNRLRDCASFLVYAGKGSNKKLKTANFCRVRLCPVCQWRRSLKLFSQVSKIFDTIRQDGLDYKYIFLTLTVPNVSGEELSETIDLMMKSWNKMAGYKDFKKRVKGFYRGMEITHNMVTNTFHPHFHCVFAVNASYFNSRLYFKQSDWADMWSRAVGIDNLIVDVRRIKGDPAKAVAEVVKYTVKETDYIFPEDFDKSVEIVELLDRVLNKRRFVSFGGILKTYHKKLNLDDAEDGDLLHVGDDDDISVDAESPEFVYIWHTGYRQYFGE